MDSRSAIWFRVPGSEAKTAARLDGRPIGMLATLIRHYHFNGSAKACEKPSNAPDGPRCATEQAHEQDEKRDNHDATPYDITRQITPAHSPALISSAAIKYKFSFLSINPPKDRSDNFNLLARQQLRFQAMVRIGVRPTYQITLPRLQILRR